MQNTNPLFFNGKESTEKTYDLCRPKSALIWKMTERSERYLRNPSQDLSREIQLANEPQKSVYKYSYNLGILELRTQRKENAVNLSTKRSTDTQDCVCELNAFREKLKICRHNHAGERNAVSTVMNVALTGPSSLKGTEKSRLNIAQKTQESVSKSEILCSQNRCQKIYVKVCSEGNDNFEESVEASSAKHNASSTDNLEVCTPEVYAGEQEDDKNGNTVKNDFHPPVENILRAARVLGVCLPSKELYSNLNCRGRRNGVCEGNDSCLQHGALLKILNKRF